MSYIPHTKQQREEMLAAIGVASLDDLFTDIPPAKRIPHLNIPDGISEHEVLTHMRQLANRNATDLTCFLGGGFYDHTIPAAVDALASRGEFFTAYTPYQPEVAQGTLQAIFEYQSMVCRLTGLDVANASLYDGGTALNEAVLTAVNATGRNTVLFSGNVNPLYRQIVHTHTANLGLNIVELPHTIGQQIDRHAITAAITADTAAVVVQNPDFFGTVDDFTDIAALAHQAGALLITSFYPVSLGILKRPADMGTDIATAEGQSLGLPLSFGGPYLGIYAARQALVRRIPGRVVGESLDRHGNRSFVLTLQAREQHIRRERATSNICTNQALCALRSTIHLSLLGKAGLVEQAETCLHKAHYARERLAAVKGVTLRSQAPTFNEFVIDLPDNADTIATALSERGIAAGLPLGKLFPDAHNSLLVAVTEKRSQTEIDAMANTLKEVLS